VRTRLRLKEVTLTADTPEEEEELARFFRMLVRNRHSVFTLRKKGEMYRKKHLSETDLDNMRINLVFRRYRLSEEPHCDFCGNANPVYCYAAIRMSTGEWKNNWRWCACEECSAAVDNGNWRRVEEKVMKWLKSKFPNTPDDLLRYPIRDAMAEFMIYAAKVPDRSDIVEPGGFYH